MAELEQKTTDSRDITYFKEMTQGAENILEKSFKPWKWALIGLVVSIVICNIIWGSVYTYTVSKFSQELQAMREAQSQNISEQGE